MADQFELAQWQYDSATPPEYDVCEHGVSTDEDCDECYEVEANERDEED